MKAPLPSTRTLQASSTVLPSAYIASRDTPSRTPKPFELHRAEVRGSRLLLRATAVEEKSGMQSGIDMQERAEFLKKDLQNLFNDKGVDQSQYDDKVNFMDPITKYSSVRGYMFNIKMLKTIFAPSFQLHDLRQTNEFEITTRWTMIMQPTFNRVLRLQRWWDPRLVFTGVSIMGVNPENGKFNKHIDLWDALEPQNQEFLSREGVAHVFGQLTARAETPNLDTPDYTILKKKKHYEIRRYEPFVVAETEVEASSSQQGERSPAAEGGRAFNALASFIFGKNREGRKLAMTTPVFTDNQGKMQFVVGKGTDAGALPTPETDAVRTRQREGGVFAAATFSGRATEGEAAGRRDALRERLRADGVRFVAADWALARYNDPSTKPDRRRNEVLIPVEAFDIWAT